MDLAGSERTGEDAELVIRSKERLAELTYINNSLLILGQCISALADSHRNHIPYRRSKLTRILKDSLEGDSRVLLVACVSPSVSCAAETMATLQFASKAMRVKIDPKRSGSPKTGVKGSLERLREAYEKEKQIRLQLESYIHSTNSLSLRAELEAVKRQNLDLSARVQQQANRLTGGANSKVGVRHVRFRSRVENEEELDAEQRERLAHNAMYKDDTIFENISVFRETAGPVLPYEHYFREPTNLNAGYMGDDPDWNPLEYKPKGRFALLNNSLTLQHERIQSQQHVSEPAASRKAATLDQPSKAGEESKIGVSPQIHIEESTIVREPDPGRDSDSASIKAYESLKNELDHLVSAQQQSSMNNDSLRSREDSPARVTELYQRILAEISSLKKSVIMSRGKGESPQRRGLMKTCGDTRQMFEELRREIARLNHGASPGSGRRAMEIVDQMQRIFEQVCSWFSQGGNRPHRSPAEMRRDRRSVRRRPRRRRSGR